MTPLEINKKIAEVKGWKPGDKCNGYGGELPNSSDGWFCDECGYIGQWGEDSLHEKQITNVEGGGDMTGDDLEKMIREEKESFNKLNRQFFGLHSEGTKKGYEIKLSKDEIQRWAEEVLKMKDQLVEAKKVIKYYANEKNWEKKPTEMGEFSLVCFDDRGGTARDWLKKWGGK